MNAPDMKEMPGKEIPLIPDSLLAWSQQDIENRVGFRGGRHTGVNNYSSFIGALLLSMALYALTVFVLKHLRFTGSFTAIYLRPGNQATVIPATLFFFWGVMVLWLKSSKLAFQRKALELAVVPDAPDFILNESTATGVLNRLHGLVDHPRHFVLLNRIDRALSNLKNIGQVNDITSILRGQAENDEDQVASTYALLNGLVWAIPVLGFIGTVMGLSTAIGGFGLTLQSGGDLAAIRSALQGVTAGLATAFETTLVALFYALILQLGITFRQQQEMAFLDECNDYCHSHIVSKLRLIDDRPSVSEKSDPERESGQEVR